VSREPAAVEQPPSLPLDAGAVVAVLLPGVPAAVTLEATEGFPALPDAGGLAGVPAAALLDAGFPAVAPALLDVPAAL
jgi:hypothetical protein